MKARTVLVLLVLALAPSPETRAWVQLRTSTGKDEAWDLDTGQPNVVGGKITYYLHPDGTVWESDEKTFAAVRAGIAAWSQPEDTRIAFEEDPGRAASSHKSGDRVNLVRWSSGGLGPFTLATTYPYISGGYLRDADMLLNEAFRWAANASGTSSSADIQAVVAHEWGHAIGLDHVPLHGATMYYTAPLGSIYFRTLSGDDAAAVSALYPSASYGLHRGSIRGNVDVADKSNDRAVHVVAIDAATGEPSASTLSESDGTYEIRGLPVGAYIVVAAPAVPLGVLNSWWGSGSQSFLPAAAETGGKAAILPVAAGAATVAPDITVSNRTDPAEPDDSAVTATAMAVGQVRAARIEEYASLGGGLGDVDWYRFDGEQGQDVSLRVHANELGSDVDPILEIYRYVGGRLTNLAQSTDIRSEFTYATRIEGPNVDAALPDFTLPVSATYYVRVRPSPFSGADSTDSFYLLSVTGSFDAPNADRTEVLVTPETLDADGASTAVVTVVPRTILGDPVGSGASVSITNSGGGVLGTVAYVGGGAYEATLRAPSAPGTDVLSVTVSNSDGAASLPNAASVTWVGPAAADFTTIDAAPRRIAAGGAETSVVLVTPRDALGNRLGTGRDVTFTLDGSGSLSPARDNGDGSYETTLASGTAGETVAVGVRVDGVDPDVSAAVDYGFDLLAVVEEVGAEVDLIAVDAKTPGKAAKSLASASGRLERAREALAGPEPDRNPALGQVLKAAKMLAKSEKRLDGVFTVEPALRDLTLATRQTAAEAVEEAEAVGDPRLAKNIEKALAKLAAGDDALAGGKHVRAVRKYRGGYRKAVKR